MTDTIDVFGRLREAAPDDSNTVNCYFLGDGITVIIGQGTGKPDTELSLTMVDEKSSDTMVGTKIVNSTVNTSEVSSFEGYSLWNQQTCPIDLLNGIAKAVSGVKPLDAPLDWDVARRDSLRTPVAEGIDAAKIRTVMARLVEVSA